MLGTPFHPKPCINRSHLANTTSFHTTRTTVPQKKPGSILLSSVQCFTFGMHFTTEFLNAPFHSAETRARAVPALCGIFLNLKILYFSFCLNKKSLAASYFPPFSASPSVRTSLPSFLTLHFIPLKLAHEQFLLFAGFS